MMNFVKWILGIIVNFFAVFLKIDNKKLLFQSGRGRVDCNPYALYRYIKDNNVNDFKCMWIVEKDADVSNLCEGDYCYYRTIRCFFEMATSKYWIRSQSLGGIVKKKKNQVYIQTWHGAGNFKKCELDCLPVNKRPTETVGHAKDWDYLICTDKLNKIVMESSVNFKKKSIILGNMESDLLINYTSSYVEKVKENVGLVNNNKKVIMYAPTFRDYELDKDADDLNIPIMGLGDLKEYVVLLRLHPLISKKIEKMDLPDNFINVGWYPSILDLYLLTDILITDYSSVIFPYMILEKKLIMYPFDYDVYVNLRGGFYLDYKNDLPGPIVYNEKDLIKEIKNIDNYQKKYYNKVKKFNEKYNSLNDGKVCKRFVELLKSGKFK